MGERDRSPDARTGLCRSCGVEYALNASGKVRRHRVEGRMSPACPGTHLYPLTPAERVVRR